MTPDRDGRYLPCYYTKAASPKFNIYVARSPIQDEGAVGSWKKYYQGAWDEPGLGGHDTPFLTAEGAGVGQCFVTYVKAWDQYVIVFCLLAYKDWETGQPTQRGVYLATSRDGIRWTAPQRVMAALVVQKTGLPVVQHPTVVITSATKNRLQGRLFHAYSPRWPTPHSLAASTITIQLKQSTIEGTGSPSPVSAEIAWTYLVDLPRIKVSDHRGWWSDRGELLLEGAPGEPDVRKPLQFEGEQSSHGIYLHARPSGNA